MEDEESIKGQFLFSLSLSLSLSLFSFFLRTREMLVGWNDRILIIKDLSR
jgi:hypothetical protein